MYKTFTLTALALLMTLTGLQAQEEDDTRYIETQFGVMPVTTDTFATNISILTGSPVQQGLSVDVYMPMDDTATNRAVVAIFPTGNFLPAYINQGVYGTKRDSANVYLARQLAARGFVSMVAEYRQGWLPTADDPIVQTETLLRAAYRGGQDAKALARYLRKTIAEDDNPYGIDGDKIAFWGFGTGGYVTLTHAFLDSIAEIEQNLQFYDSQANPQLLVQEARDGNPQGTTAAPLNLVNNPDYSDDVALTVNAGGAIGDTTWIESGPNNTDGFVGFHRVEDPFAPYNIGAVIVPTTNSTVINDVGGAYAVTRITNREGINDEFEAANDTELDDKFSDFSESLNELNATYQTMMLDSTGKPLSYDNLFPFIGDGGHWNWSNETVDRQFIAGINASGVANLNADFIIGTEKALNPNYNDPAAAKRVIDTMIAYFIPRAFVALNLDATSTDLITPASVALDLFPNPAGDMGFTVRVAETLRIRQLDLFDINGRNVRQMTGLEQSSIQVDRGNLPRGQYIVRLRLDDGVTARMVTLE
jgi:hypothetical protein